MELKTIQLDILQRLQLPLGEVGSCKEGKSSKSPSKRDSKKGAKAHLKSVLLAYTDGASNWAHQDDSADWDVQGLLMLSQPTLDFQGGDLYVLNGKEGWQPRSVQFQNAGDVAIFKSNKAYFHGMHTVEKGSSPHCRRVAVGLFHKL